MKVRHAIMHAPLIVTALVCFALVGSRFAQADSAAPPAPRLGVAIFGGNDRSPIDIAQRADGSTILLSVFPWKHSEENQFVVQRLDAAGGVIWRTLLSVHGDPPKRSPTTARSGLEYNDEVSLLDLWKVSSSDEDVLGTHLIASADSEHDPIIVADRLLGLWALSGEGKVLWHRHLFGPLGLSLLTAFARSNDGSVVLGGSGAREGGRCDAATVTKLDGQGQPIWRWHSDYEPLAGATHVVPLADGGVAVLVDSLNPNRYLAGFDETPCRRFGDDYRRLIWLDRDGHETRRIAVPPHVYVEGMTALSDGSIAIIAWRTGALLFRRLSADGRRVIVDRVYNLRGLFGWSKEISPWFVDIAAADADTIFLATYYCPNSVWPCLGRGVHAIQVAPDGRLRRMPDRMLSEPLLATQDPLSRAVLIFTPGGIERIPLRKSAE